jgi:trk system potassium uptake protein TrkH
MTLRVDLRTTASLAGTVLKYIALAMAVPLALGVVYQRDAWVFVVSMVFAVGIGLALERLDSDPDMGPSEALLLVASSWLVVAIVGAVPYVLAGYGTASTLAHPINALFESMSGFTTTGATVMGEISTDRHSRAVLMWRQLTQWLGGMGIIVLMVAILPELAVNGAELIRRESPGPELQKLTPRIAETARVLWLVYFAFTLVLVCVLYGLHLLGLAPNMDLFNAVAHAFSTMPTGGFSPQADSIAAFSAVVQWVIIPFMVVAGTNYALFWHLLDGDVRTLFRDTEFRIYAGAVAALSAVLAVLLYGGTAPAQELGGVTAGNTENALRQAAFQIASLMNSTGFATSDFAQWDGPAQAVLLFAMFIGGSAGSTGGGIKVVRWIIVLKAARRELVTASRPDVVRPIRLGGNVVDEESVKGVLAFTMLYIALFGVSTMFFVLDGLRVGYELTVLEAMSASLATLGNIGPGFGSLGPFGSYLAFPAETKLVMVFLMWVGRLEIIPVLAVFTGAFWKR